MDHDSVVFVASIRFELEAGMVAALTGEEHESRLEDVDVRTWSHSVEELHLHRVHVLLCEVER